VIARGPATAAILVLAGLISFGSLPLGQGEAAAAAPRPASRPTSIRLESRSESVYGLKIHYLEGGTGRPIIFLHGLTGSAEGMRSLATPLAASSRVLVPDQIGFGASEKPTVDYSLETLVDFLDRFMIEVGIDRASLVGHAMGARVACLFALAHPERVDRLVLVSGAGQRPNLDPAILAAINFHSVAGARQLLNLLYFNDVPHASRSEAEEMFARRLHSGIGYTIGRIQESYARGEGSIDDLSAIKAPTLILWGKEDEIASSGAADKAHRQIEGSQLVLLEHCGHLPMAEAPAQVDRALSEFFARQR
jgi:pimeloyl-ACP methyl ester carboxylesterase